MKEPNLENLENPEEKDKKETIELNENVKLNSKDEKSLFEKYIIEAYKQTNSIESVNKLNLAFGEIHQYINDIKQSKGTKNLINKNILDKVNRIIERKNLNSTIILAKIFNTLLESSNYNILSNDANLLISLSNSILNILEIIYRTNIAFELEKKCSSFLNFLNTNTNFTLEEEQEEIIKDLISTFPTKNSSDSYKNFPFRKKIIMRFCEEDSEEDKLNGILQLIDYFNQTISINEQYDMLLEHCTQIIKVIINKPNEKYRKVYFELGNFILNLLFNYKYLIYIDPTHRNQISQFFYLCDFVSSKEQSISNIKVKNLTNNLDDINFLNDTLFEITEQKDILLKCENIFSICLLVLNTLIIYENFFDLQFICYLILKRIYFIFPQFIKNIEDLLTTSLINLCSFKNEEEKKKTLECRQFLNYLLNSENEELKSKLNLKIELKNKNINIKLEENEKIENNLIEYEKVNLLDFNLKTGYPLYKNIEAGNGFFKYIEVEEKNSLIYIGYSTEGYDINFYLLKYCPNIPVKRDFNDDYLSDVSHFVNIVKIERNGEIPIKILLFVKEPGIYKIVFDNSYSWFNEKNIKCRINILKSLSEINFDNIDENKDKKENINSFINI